MRSCTPARVPASNALRTSSSSTIRPACVSGSVSPGFSGRPDLPGLTSRYFSPSVERGRTVTTVSERSGSAAFSSLRSSSDTKRPGAVLTGLIAVIAPIRLPPTRTSLPLTSSAASGTSTLTS